MFIIKNPRHRGHCQSVRYVKSVQIRIFFWSVFEHFLRSDKCILLNEGYEFFTKAVVRIYYVKKHVLKNFYKLSRRRSLSFRNQSIDLLCKLLDWFLYDRDLRHVKVNDRCFHEHITAQKMKFSIKDFFSKCGQIRRKLQIWSHLNIIVI